jgi:DNA-binding NarL/FixJ family response regulator
VRTIQAAARVTEAFAAQDPDALVEAARMWQASPRRLEAVRVARRVSDALVRLDRPQLAEMVGAESSRAYMAQGARMKADRDALRLSDPAPSPPSRRRRNGRPTTGWDALTRAERVVATFVERGESNAEIATRLVLSRRTVESHVSNILAKLGMRSRADLILAAANRNAPQPPPGAADGMGVVDTRASDGE